MKSMVALTVALVVSLCASVQAAGQQQQSADKKEIIQDKNELKRSRDCLDRLNSLIDRWHEANLEGNEKKIHKYEQAIINTLIKDINATFHWVSNAESERTRSREQVRAGEAPKAALDDERDLARVRVLLASKQGVLYKLRESESFSFRYRLLANYQDLLRKELGMVRVELAEDVKDVRIDGK